MTITPVEHEATRYWVSSATRRGVQHLVDSDYEGGWACSCHDFMCRERECKHIRVVKNSLAEKVQSPRPKVQGQKANEIQSQGGVGVLAD